MRVFITGASGYVGFNVALALRRAGHQVFGLTRTNEKAQMLARNEIQPVVGDLQKPETFLPFADQCSIIIHAAVDYELNTFVLDRLIVQAFLESGKRGLHPKTFIYTSSTWVYGNTGGTPVDESDSLSPPKLLKRHAATEKIVLESPDVQGLVVRPGCVYGRQGGLTQSWFKGAYQDNSLKIVGDGSNYWAMVHVDDLAEGYLCVTESGHSHEVFNFVEYSRFKLSDIASAVVQVTGYSGEIKFVPVAQAAETMGDFAECLALDQHVDAQKATRLLGWHPKHEGFVGEIGIYFQSWKATLEPNILMTFGTGLKGMNSSR